MVVESFVVGKVTIRLLVRCYYPCIDLIVLQSER